MDGVVRQGVAFDGVTVRARHVNARRSLVLNRVASDSVGIRIEEIDTFERIVIDRVVHNVVERVSIGRARHMDAFVAVVVDGVALNQTAR